VVFIGVGDDTQGGILVQIFRICGVPGQFQGKGPQGSADFIELNLDLILYFHVHFRRFGQGFCNLFLHKVMCSAYQVQKIHTL
jgi:hypothetical protein